ncbi:MAG: acyl-CoA dehydratase activase [Desulfarculaceae bacterium]
MTIAAGVDVGASATKVAVVDHQGKLLGGAVLRSGTDFALSAQKGFDQALAQAGIKQKEVAQVFACGYGRKNVSFSQDTRTEIACHAAGAFHHFPRTLTVVDIGGQDNKIIKINQEGVRTSFKMNRKCAAGTGAFLEEMALRLDLPLERFNQLAEEAQSETTLGAYCTVFTATEVLGKIREGVAVQSLVKGLFRSVIKRVREMDTFEGAVIMTGGVVEHNPYLAQMLGSELGCEVFVPPHPQLTGAEGAALLALRHIHED